MTPLPFLEPSLVDRVLHQVLHPAETFNGHPCVLDCAHAGAKIGPFHLRESKIAEYFGAYVV